MGLSCYAQIASMQNEHKLDKQSAKEAETKREVKAKEILTLQFGAVQKHLADIEDSLVTISEDNDDLTRLTKQISKHWKLHSWARDTLNETRQKIDLPIKAWPKLD